MGLNPSREEKLKMMKTSKSRKIIRKLNRLGKKGKLSRKTVDGLKNIKARKSVDSRKRATNVEDDWIHNREAHYNDEAEDNLPIDMLDADINWENTSFASMKRRHSIKSSDECLDFESKRRRFDGQLNDNLEEMLPIKLKDGTLLRPTREIDADQKSEGGDAEERERKSDYENLSTLSPVELLARRKKMLEEFKQIISTYAHSLLSNPQENVLKLRSLFQLCEGQNVHSLVRESVQKLAVASMMQIFIDIIPGYAIREITEEEKQQKSKKDTKRLQFYEESLLRYYLKFLMFCEKMSAKLFTKNSLRKDTFSYKIGILSIRSMNRLLISVPHFNYGNNIISTLIKMSLCKNLEVVNEVCGTLSQLFHEDLNLKITLFATKCIASLVARRKGQVPPELISTFLTLNIKEVKNDHPKLGKRRIYAQKAKLRKERMNKTARKYKKQLDKLETDLKEIDAAESLTTKLKFATESMKHVFQCYFSILKRMPNLALLEPVLEGLNKFAHLLNVEFFEDIIITMEDLIDNQHLHILDQLHCVNTVFVILSGDGQLLNIDPSRFYRSVYRLINILPFEKNAELRRRQMIMLTRTVDIMLNDRRKQVPLSRVAAFVKRLLAVATVMDDCLAICILSLVRSIFIAHPKIVSLITEDESDNSIGGTFRGDIDDPDVANALGGDVRGELKLLAKRRHRNLSLFAQNILAEVPSSGPLKLSPQLTSVKPWVLMEKTMEESGGYDKVEMKYMDGIRKFCEKRKQQFTSNTLQYLIENWISSRENV